MNRTEFLALMLTPFLAFFPKIAKPEIIEFPNGSKILFNKNVSDASKAADQMTMADLERAHKYLKEHSLPVLDGYYHFPLKDLLKT